MAKQLILDLKLKDNHTLDNFIAGDNSLIVKLLENMARQQGEPQLFIWGGPGVGKSHLMQAACHLATNNNHTVSYLPLVQLIDYSPQLLEGLEYTDLICIDDIDQICGKSDWQEQLFNLINRVRMTRNYLLLSANLPPNELELGLEDLRSRLNWGPVVSVRALSDEDLQLALQQRAHLRGFELSDTVCGYMLKHYARDTGGLFEKLQLLEHASLAQQRLITVPFVKEVIG